MLCLSQISNGLNSGQLHLFGNGRRADVQRAAEDKRKAQHVIDLVRVIRAPRCNDGVITHCPHLVRQDLRCRVGQRQDQRILAHLGHHVGLQNAARRQAQKHIGALNHFCQLARIGFLGIPRLDRVHILWPPLIDHTMDIGHPDVLERNAELHQQTQAGQCRCPSARSHKLDLLEVLAQEV